MVKKKPFINKKAAQHFHVVHRSQRDPLANDPNASKFVLLSSSSDIKKSEIEQDEMTSDFSSHDEEDEDDDLPDLVAPPVSASASASASASPLKSNSMYHSKKPRRVRFGHVVVEDLVDEFGMIRDGYDYSQHMKEMGEGQFYSSSGRFENQTNNALLKKIELPEDVLPSTIENDRLLEAITLTTDLMDEDLREALINDEAFELLDDDFMLQATSIDKTNTNQQEDGFDYDAHIAKLIMATTATNIKNTHTKLTDDDRKEEEEEDHCTDYEEEEEEDQQRLLDEMFDKTLAFEYEDEKLGELDENDPETRGEMLLEGQLLASIVQDFEQHVTKERTTTLEKERLDFSLILGKEEEDNEEEEEEEEYQYEDLFERNNVYLHEKKEKEQWDCETIISTYSTLDNHPTRIKEPSLYNNKKKKKKKENQQQSLSLPLVPETKILLSKKTGMPLDVAMSRTNRTTKMTTINDFIGKKTKNETKEEKKIRKKVMKLLKKDRRVEKKQTKQAFKEEEQRQFKQQRGGGGGGGGAATTAATPVSIFKYS